VNDKHLSLCSSIEWADAVERWIIPRVVNDIDLGDDVLEVGPGPGLTTDVLRGLVDRLTAVEVDQSLADALSTRLAGSNVEVVHADATEMPFSSGRFSAALSFTMLHHVPSVALQDKLFGEVASVLRPGGVFAGTDSRDGEDFRELHTDDVCVPIDPVGFDHRLFQAGFAQVLVETDEYGVHFRATTPNTRDQVTVVLEERLDRAEADVSRRG
jgi:SAM-dependent methyltransferase